MPISPVSLVSPISGEIGVTSEIRCGRYKLVKPVKIGEIGENSGSLDRPGCTLQVDGAQRRVMVHNIALYC